MALLELDDIQSGVLRPRPTPFAATYILLRIDDRAAGRALMRRLSGIVASAAHPESPARDTWVSASLTFAGLKSLGVSQASLDSFSPQFRQGMAARARQLRDVGENAPEHWEKPLGTDDVHVVLTGISTDAVQLEKAIGAGARGVSECSRNHADLAAGLPRSSQRDRTVRFQGRHQPSGDRRQRYTRNEPARGSIEAGRVRSRIPDEYGGVPGGPATGDPGPQW